jgi:hypothetical protein
VHARSRSHSSTVVGALIVAHRPGNGIGGLFSAIALLAATGGLAQEYASYAYVTRPGALPGAIAAGWYAAWTWYPTLALAVVFTLFLFPTGRLVSPRWRPAAWLAGAATVAFTALAALQPTLAVVHDRVVPNPIGIAAVGDPEQSTVGKALFNLIGLSIAVAFCGVRRPAEGSSHQPAVRGPDRARAGHCRARLPRLPSTTGGCARSR